MKKYTINGREYKAYELSNNEVLDLIKGGEKELTETALERFESQCCTRNEETKDELFARQFGDFVNGVMSSPKDVAKKMAQDHRYLQSEMFKVCVAYIEKLAENYDKGYYDPRNEWACKTAKDMVNVLKG